MNAATLPREGAEDSSLQQLAQQSVEQWSELCQRFLDRQRRELLESAPSPEKLQEHRAALKLMLRVARALYLTSCDPDYTDQHLAGELRGRLLQFEHSWRMIHDPMPEAKVAELDSREARRPKALSNELVHLKDMKKGTPRGALTGSTDVKNDAALGEGLMDLPMILKAAKAAGVKYYFIEDESPWSERQIPKSFGCAL